MPRCWYVLLRFWLRVDHVMVRLREVSLRASLAGGLQQSRAEWGGANMRAQRLRGACICSSTPLSSTLHRIDTPKSASLPADAPVLPV
jgi:hypothetical protein